MDVVMKLEVARTTDPPLHTASTDTGAEASLLDAGSVLHRVETVSRAGRGHEGGPGRNRFRRGGGGGLDRERGCKVRCNALQVMMIH